MGTFVGVTQGADRRSPKDTRNKLPAYDSKKQDLAVEEKIQDIIRIGKNDMEASIDLRNTTAITMLVIATRVVRQRNDNKGWKSDDLKAIDKLKSLAPICQSRLFTF